MIILKEDIYLWGKDNIRKKDGAKVTIFLNFQNIKASSKLLFENEVKNWELEYEIVEEMVNYELVNIKNITRKLLQWKLKEFSKTSIFQLQ